MTAVDQILEELRAGMNPGGRFCMGEHTMQAMLDLENPAQLIGPILDLIGNNPDVDLGTPGELVLFVEQFYNCGYEELLMQSVMRTPTPHNIWMLHRCFYDETDSRHAQYKEVIEKLRKTKDIPEEIKREIDRYSWD